ncbi:unnamed protein product [Laminaria digitata]
MQDARRKQAEVRAAELQVQKKGETAVAGEAAFQAETAVAKSMAEDWKESRRVREALGRNILQKGQSPKLVRKPPPAHDPKNTTLRTENPRQGPVNIPRKVATPEAVAVQAPTAAFEKPADKTKLTKFLAMRAEHPEASAESLLAFIDATSQQAGRQDANRDHSPVERTARHDEGRGIAVYE